MVRSVAACLFVAFLAAPVGAGPIGFESGWAEQRLSMFGANDYRFGPDLEILSEDAVSLTWKALPQSEWAATSASWTWRVDQSVPATDLARKGGDDRNISVYFVFLPADVATELQGAGIRRLMGNKDVRILQYAWGGDHARGQILPSPYAPGQGVTVALRQAGLASCCPNLMPEPDYKLSY